jgi:hypothetical protein
MRKLLFERSFQPFFVTALVSAIIALFLKTIHPESLFDISIYNSDYTIANYKIWFLFSLYLFSLSAIYYSIDKAKLRTKSWLMISHYIFIVLFLIFFVLFSVFSSSDMQKLMTKMPLLTFLSIYAMIFIVDVILFFLGIIFLIINLFSLKRNKQK